MYGYIITKVTARPWKEYCAEIENALAPPT
jgi:hypothetical protein